MRWNLITSLVVLATVLVVATPVAAQVPPVKNPTGIAFTPSPDHAALTSYEADIRSSAGTVVQTISLGKPAPNASGEIVVTLNVQPIAFGTYTIVVRSLAGSLSGPPSVPSDAWERVPGAPSKPTMR